MRKGFGVQVTMREKQGGTQAERFLCSRISETLGLVRVQGENVVGRVSQLPFFVLGSTLGSCRSRITEPWGAQGPC